MTTKETVKRVLEHEDFCKSWTRTKEPVQVRPKGTNHWVTTTCDTLHLEQNAEYRVKPVEVTRWAVYNCTPVNPGDGPYFLCDFPTQEAANLYIRRNFRNDKAFGAFVRDLKVVALNGEIAV